MNEQQEGPTAELRSAQEQISRLAAAVQRLEKDNERLRQEAAEMRPATDEDLLRWRREALAAWTRGLTATERVRELETKYGEVGHAAHLRALEIDRLDRELANTRATLSWRVTAPLRKIRKLGR